MQHQASVAYQTQQIMTAPPVRLVAMLYERALRALRDAIRAIDAGEVQTRFENVERASEIVVHLAGTLDTERGGEVAANLSRLYVFMLRRLSDVNLRNDAQAARDVIGLLEPLAESWRELARTASGGGASAAPPATVTAAPRGIAVSA
ncbi:MAG: flagellar export chaperone FliS [Alphaproteobacteria bacterium]